MTHRCCMEGINGSEPCWGEVAVRDYGFDADRDTYPIYACEGHSEITYKPYGERRKGTEQMSDNATRAASSSAPACSHVDEPDAYIDEAGRIVIERASGIPSAWIPLRRDHANNQNKRKDETK